jgi:hypothetical protein
MAPAYSKRSYNVPTVCCVIYEDAVNLDKKVFRLSEQVSVPTNTENKLM